MHAIQWTGPQHGEKPFFLCVHRESGHARDEWSPDTADEFRNELSAKICADGLKLTHWKPVKYPRGMKPEKPLPPPQTYGTYTHTA